MKKNVPFLKIICWLLLIANLCVLTSYILFKESPASIIHAKKTSFRTHGPRFDQKNLQLFATINRISNSHMNDRYKYWNIGGNILGFVPLGFLLSVLLFRNGKIFKTILAVFLISLFFETIQLYTGLGIFDVDDLLLNTLGGLFGSLFSLFVPRSLKNGYRRLPAPDF
ncbi:MAG: VanZ family protein [Chitinophagaceae bacterium]